MARHSRSRTRGETLRTQERRSLAKEDKDQVQENDEPEQISDLYEFDTRQHSQELQVLVALYDTTGGADWSERGGWLSNGRIPCEWTGVVCDANSYVTALQFQDNNLSGILPASMLWDLPHLERIDLSLNPNLVVDFNTRVSLSWDSSSMATVSPVANNQSSIIPTVVLVNETKAQADGQENNNEDSTVATAPVEYLDLSNTATSDLKGIHRIASTLQIFDISRSHIKGDAAPQEIRRLSQLSFLNMSDLFLNSSANGFFSNADWGPNTDTPLINLQYWHASNASLTGTLPTAVGKLNQLRVLDWSFNSWRGNLPSQMADLSNLEVVYLQQDLGHPTSLTGTLPALEEMPYLQELDLSEHQLSGTIPTSFLAGIANTTLPLYVNLQGNELSGSLPAELTRFANLNLGVTNNRISHLPQALCQQDEWMDGMVEEYGCDAILCPPGTYSEDYGRQVSGDTKCSDCNYFGAAPFYGSTKCQEVILSAQEGGPLSQYDILVELYSTTGGPEWTESSGWLKEKNECKWYGVECQGGNVQELILPNNNMRGGTPLSLFRLPNLKRLVLTDNPDLEVDFYMMDEAEELKELLISNTATYSLLGISNATNLQSLEINGTQISGPNLGEVYSLTTLRRLNMGNNVLDQSLPEAIGGLSKLVSLRAPDAALYGTLPTSLNLLTNLVILDLSENVMVGPLREQTMNNLGQLRILDLHGQRLPFGGSLPDLKGVVSLLQFDMSSNSLTGSIPATFLNGVKDKFRSLDIDLKNNLLTGTLPLELALFQEVNLDVTENRIEGIPEIFCIKEDWMNGLVSDFGCDAILCPPSTSNAEGRMVAQDRPCEACPSDTLPYFGPVECPAVLSRPSEQTPASPAEVVISSERDILELLFQSTGGPISWVRKDNWLDRDTDICEWYGVGCDADGQVESLVLTENGLMNSTPVQLFQLSHLERLFLDQNPDLNVDLSGLGLSQARKRFLKGKTRMLEASSLQSLVICNTATSSVAGVSKASSLQVLDLDATKITGEDLDELMTMASLQSLRIGNTRVNRGIPDAIIDLTELREFAAQNCGITGVIPQSVGTLTRLAVLDLSGNDLIGTLPASLGELRDIRILDLHDQGVSTGGGIGGTIPPFDSLPALAKLDLSQNRLSGEIPTTFLSGIFDKSAGLEVILRQNSIRGGLPETLSKFSDLHIDVTGNLITDLPESLCEQESWMNGNTAEFGCDGILCEPGTYNSNGRQVLELEPCDPCPVDPKPYYGANSCRNSPDAVDGDTMVCPDGSVCYNHGTCLESAVLAGSYVCDCSSTGAYGIPFAGIACEYKATDICHTSGVVGTNNITSFCTNNGHCVYRVEPGAQHEGCECNKNLWQGDYCEKRIGSLTPSNEYPMKPTVDIKQICPDDHVCENGSQCIESAENPGEFQCDCTDIAAGQLPVAGENCQYPATSLCSISPPFTSFCVNGGACVSLVQGGSGHTDCLCPEGYMGVHCEITEFGVTQSASDLIIPSSGGSDGMESWQMALVFVLPAVAILMIVGMIIAAYSRARKKDLKYVNVDELVDSGYEKYSIESKESPKKGPIRDTESSDFETPPPSILDRALAEPDAGFYSLPPVSKEFHPDDGDQSFDDARGELAGAGPPPSEQNSGESPTTSISKSSRSSDVDDPPSVVVGAAMAAVTASAAVAVSAEEEEAEDIDSEDGEPDELSTILEGSRTETEASDLGSPKRPEREEMNPSTMPRGLPFEESANSSAPVKHMDDSGSENFRDALEERPRVAFVGIPSSSAESDDEDQVVNSFIGDIEDTPPRAATGKSLFAGAVQSGEDSVSFLDQSVGMSEDSERSASSLQQRVQVSVEPSLAATMFGGGREVSETSSGELSLNF